MSFFLPILGISVSICKLRNLLKSKLLFHLGHCPNLYSKLYYVVISLLEAFDFFMYQKEFVIQANEHQLPLSPCWIIWSILAISRLLA